MSHGWEYFLQYRVHIFPKVFLACWLSSPVVRDFMERHNYTEIGQVEQHYVDRVLELAELTPIKYITWQDPADRGTKVSLVLVVFSVTVMDIIVQVVAWVCSVISSDSIF